MNRPDLEGGDAVAAIVAYVYVREAPDSFADDLRSRLPDDPPLHFVTMTDGAYQAFAVFTGSDKDALKPEIHGAVRGAGGTDARVTISTETFGIKGIRWM